MEGSAGNTKSTIEVHSSPEEVSFLSLFGRGSPSEKIVQTAACGMTKSKLVRMGTMYLTSYRLCFSSSFMDGPVSLAWGEISSIEKRTAFVFDSIVVTTDANLSYSFTTFLGGATTQVFQLIRSLWTLRESYETPTGNDREANVSTPGANKTPMEEARHSISVKRESAAIDVVSESKPGSPTPEVSRSIFHDPSLQVSSTNSVLKTQPETPKEDESPRSPRSFAHSKSLGEPMEIRRFFPKLPPSEALIDAFQCSLVSGVHRLGKLYITTNYALFTSVMVSEEVQIPLTEVTKISKERVLKILPGITVTLRNGVVHSFTNFVDRDTAYNVLASCQAKAAQVVKPVSNSTTSSKLVFNTTTSIADAKKIPDAFSLNDFSKVETDYGTGLSAYNSFTKEVMPAVELPVGKTVIDVFGTCFDDGTKLLELYHTNRGDLNQTWEAWHPAKNGAPFCGQRQFTCTTPVKAMMGRMYGYVEFQRYAFLCVNGAPHLVMQFSSQVAGVMFGDAFRVEALAVFQQRGNGAEAKVTMRAYGYVQFLRNVWVKGKIMSTTLDNELPEGYKTLANMIVKELRAVPNDGQVVGEAPQIVPTPNVAEFAQEILGVEHSRNALYLYVSLMSSLLVLLLAFVGLFNSLTFSTTSMTCFHTTISVNNATHDVCNLGFTKAAGNLASKMRAVFISFNLIVLVVFSTIIWNTAINLKNV